jgi:hypothetical protein
MIFIVRKMMLKTIMKNACQLFLKGIKAAVKRFLPEIGEETLHPGGPK